MTLIKTTLAAACALAWSSLLLAQESETSATTALEGITVTANKVEEELKDIPQSISVITGEAIQEKGIRNIADLVREIPNLSSNFVYSNDVNVRGINSSIFTDANPVVIYVDGIPQSNRYAYDAFLENVDRVEVLRGPQGSLYGKDAIGGVINIVTKTPKNEWSGQVGTEVSNQQGKDLTFSVTGPLVEDRLYLSLAGKTAKQDGWVTNTYPGMKRHADRSDAQQFNLGLLYKATPDTQVRFNVSHDDLANHWISGGLAPLGTNYAALTRRAASRTRFEEETVTKTRSDAQSLSLQHKFGGGIVLDAIATNKSVKVAGDYDMDWGANPSYAGLTQFQHATMDTQTQEFRLSGGSEGATRWVGGLYLEQDKYRNTRYGGEYLMGEGKVIDMDALSTTKSHTQALFGQMMIPIGQRLELTLGGRYQRIKKDFDVDVYMQPLGTTGLPPSISLNGSHTWSAFLPKAALSYRLNPRWTTYASVAKGYLPGGYNYWPSSAVEAQNRFAPQTSINYEVGVRSDFGPLYVSASLFYMDIKDIHVYSYDRTTNMITTSNAGKGTSKGIELEANYLLSNRWEVSSALGFAHATYDQYPNPAVNGNKIEKTPTFTAVVGLQYTAGNGFYGRADVRGQGKRYFDPENTLVDGSYATVDLKVGYKTGPWEFYGYVRNLADTSYRTAVSAMSNGTLVTFGEPRRFGAGVRCYF
ncbi:TonB-dependent receptor [Diaphorobacter sp.]|uniref:TonB-dependent receptor n=1 Tax=Diaphorobacter sp. TaxID=1934310 RepID=UPI0028A6188D|nr:TonB-dependent receptor [Diaphorobacter sp.]